MRHFHPNQIHDFNPRAPCGARLDNPEKHQYPVSISIHALRAERDNRYLNSEQGTMNFNPRAPCGARQFRAGRMPAAELISIHALRAERDPLRLG